MMPPLRSARAYRSCVSPCVLFCVPTCVPPCITLGCLLVGDGFHEAPFRLARRSSYAVPNDPDETRREAETIRWNETRETRRGTGSEGEEEREFLLLGRLIYRRRFALLIAHSIPFLFPCIVLRFCLASRSTCCLCVSVSFRLVPCPVPHPRPFSSHRAFRTRGNREGSSREGGGGGRRRG